MSDQNSFWPTGPSDEQATDESPIRSTPVAACWVQSGFVVSVVACDVPQGRKNGFGIEDRYSHYPEHLFHCME